MKTVTLLHGGSLGDFLLAIRFLHGVGRHGESIERRAVARSPMSALPHVSLRLAALHDSDRIGLHRLFSDDASVRDELRDLLASSDLVIDMLAISGAAKARLQSRVGGALVSLDPTPSPDCRDHIIDQWRSRLPASVPVEAPRPELLLDMRRHDSDRMPAALLHPGSGGRVKCWPMDRFIELANVLGGERTEPSFMLGPTELDWYGDGWLHALSEHAPVIVEANLWPAAERMAAAALYVGNDAGSTHLAAAVGTPTVAIFGPTDPNVWRPIGDRVVTVSPASGRGDIGSVSVEQVAAACAALLGRR